MRPIPHPPSCLSLPILVALALSASVPIHAEDVLGPAVQAVAARDWARVRSSLEGMPDSGDVLALRGIAAYHLGAYGDAQRDLGAALAKGSRFHARVLYYRGLTGQALGAESQARAAFGLLLQTFPETPEAKAVLALVPPPPEPPAPPPPPAPAPAPEPAPAEEMVPASSRTWHATVLGGLYRDTNPHLVGVDEPTAEAEADNYRLLHGGLSWRPEGTPGVFAVSATTLDYVRQSQLDAILGTVEAGFDPEDGDGLGVRLRVLPLWIDRALFAASEELRARLDGPLADRLRGTVAAGVRLTDHREAHGLDGYRFDGRTGVAYAVEAWGLDHVDADLSAGREYARDPGAGLGEVEAALGLHWTPVRRCALATTAALRERHFAADGPHERRLRLGADLTWTWTPVTLGASVERNGTAIANVDPDPGPVLQTVAGVFAAVVW